MSLATPAYAHVLVRTVRVCSCVIGCVGCFDQVMICLLQYFVESLTVVLPYYPTGTMERVVKEGQVRPARADSPVRGGLLLIRRS